MCIFLHTFFVQSCVPLAKVQCARFEGTTREVFIDRHEFEGSIYSQIEKAYQFVLKHINLGAKINGLVHEDDYELPVDAIREAIVNAVMHRNYMEKACVQVCIFDEPSSRNTERKGRPKQLNFAPNIFQQTYAE